ncbi:MAG TPA: Na+/H+ antiporter NhaA [Woeseiaceae bacterium]|nr:Na+/H+ antiporter NhaA [Woeseiaceae bacterium]
MQATIRNFLKLESAGGILLMGAAALAILVANTPLARYYDLLLQVPVEIRVGAFQIAKPLVLWVNDGLMAVFFFAIGLELKRELLEGELSRPADVLLPAVGAVGGIVVPVGIYVAFNAGDAAALRGWAIPAATDIAFALGILLLLGNRVPVALKIFLVSLAIFDDIGAIVIIALFYSASLSALALSVAGACLLVLSIMAWRRVGSISAYIAVGIVMWAAVLKSGVHATLAGVALAAFIPMRDQSQPGRSPLKDLEGDLHSVVAFGVLPLFAFANAGVSLAGTGWSELAHPVPLGIAAGLFIGKQLGVFLFCAVAIRLGARLPEGSSWAGLYGVSVLAGVGFTMSLFIAGLAFEGRPQDASMLFDERLGILLGSLASGVAGYAILRLALPGRGRDKEDAARAVAGVR